MNNSYLYQFEGTEESLTLHPMGRVRYLILQENQALGHSVDGMLDLMKQWIISLYMT